MLPSGPSTVAATGRSRVPNDWPNTVGGTVPAWVVCTVTPLEALNCAPEGTGTGLLVRLVNLMKPCALPRGTCRLPPAGRVPASCRVALRVSALREGAVCASEVWACPPATAPVLPPGCEDAPVITD